MKKRSDIELYQCVAQGGAEAEQAFNQLYDRLSPHVYRYCRRMLGNEELTQDVFQETFLRFYRSIESDRNMTNVKGFLIRIARNLCYDARNSKHYGLAELPDELPGFAVRDEYEQKELLEIFRSVVDCLPTQYREPLVLKEYDGFSCKEISAIMEINVSTVKVRIYRAKQMIRKQMSPALAELVS